MHATRQFKKNVLSLGDRHNTYITTAVEDIVEPHSLDANVKGNVK